MKCTFQECGCAVWEVKGTSRADPSQYILG